jgi:epsilon-lactone hydrolase
MLMRMVRVLSACFLFAASHMAMAQAPAVGPTQASEAPTHNSTYIAPDGTAYVTRVVPVPKTVSPEAQAFLSRQIPDTPPTSDRDVEAARKTAEVRREATGKIALAHYPAQVKAGKIGGVPVTIVTPLGAASGTNSDVLIDLHGGAYELDVSSLVESIPIANLTHAKVVAVEYRLAPEYTFPAPVKDTIAVYRELLKTYSPSQIAIYGTSAGAVICGEVAVKIKAVGLPEPAALGIFSGRGDFSVNGDSMSFFSGAGLGGYLEPATVVRDNREYIGNTPADDPLLSPLHADLHGLPPTLFLTSTRDWLLSGTTMEHRAFLRAGVDAQLVVFEALPHAFWLFPNLPESDEAYRTMAAFFEKHLKSSIHISENQGSK